MCLSRILLLVGPYKQNPSLWFLRGDAPRSAFIAIGLCAQKFSAEASRVAVALPRYPTGGDPNSSVPILMFEPSICPIFCKGRQNDAQCAGGVLLHVWEERWGKAPSATPRKKAKELEWTETQEEPWNKLAYSLSSETATGVADALCDKKKIIRWYLANVPGASTPERLMAAGLTPSFQDEARCMENVNR